MVYFGLLSWEPSSPVLRQVFESKATDFVFLFLWSIFPVVFAYTVVHTGRKPTSSIAMTCSFMMKWLVPSFLNLDPQRLTERY